MVYKRHLFFISYTITTLVLPGRKESTLFDNRWITSNNLSSKENKYSTKVRVLLLINWIFALSKVCLVIQNIFLVKRTSYFCLLHLATPCCQIWQFTDCWPACRCVIVTVRLVNSSEPWWMESGVALSNRRLIRLLLHTFKTK